MADEGAFGVSDKSDAHLHELEAEYSEVRRQWSVSFLRPSYERSLPVTLRPQIVSQLGGDATLARFKGSYDRLFAAVRQVR